MALLTDVVDEALSALVQALRERDLAAACACFAEHGILCGTVEGEVAAGQAALGAFFAAVFAHPRTVGWRWGTPVGDTDGLAWWFVAPAVIVLIGDDGQVEEIPARLTGVVLRDETGSHLALLEVGEPHPASSADLTR